MPTRSALPQNYMTKPYTLFDDLSTTTTPWTAANTSTTAVSTDSVRNLTGSSSMRIVATAANGTYCAVDKSNVNFSFVGLSKQFMLKVWVDDPTTISQLILFVGSSAGGWTKYWSFSWIGGGLTSGQLHAGWNYLAAYPSEGVYTGGFAFSDQIVKMRVTVVPNSSNPAAVTVDSIHIDGISLPKIVITFDDGWKTVYDNAMNYMYQKGIKGTMYTIPAFLSDIRDQGLGGPSYMSSVQIAEMHSKGFTIANHTWNHTYYLTNGATVPYYQQVVSQARDWLCTNGYSNGALHLAYPKGEYDANVISMLKSLGMKTARAAGTTSRAMPHYIDDNYQMIVRGFGTTTTLTLAKQWVDYALESGGTNFFMFHQIPIDDTSSADGTTQPSLAWSVSKFQALMDYIVERGAAQYCVTIDEWYEGMTNPRYTSYPRA